VRASIGAAAAMSAHIYGGSSSSARIYGGSSSHECAYLWGQQ